ncbi:esterase/lipase family protein [Isoptericola sp. NPDC060282]|uniref:esterase/lipase family protein n=1 Tax=unclassified Isoptericola TaxID=2623355 RepID=UPI0036594D9B
MQGNPYQGFNDGSVYPGRSGDNYIYEGFVLRALKSTAYRYTDATNVVGYYPEDVVPPTELRSLTEDDVRGTVVLHPEMEERVLASGVGGTIWVYRYYDLRPRALARYGEGLRRLVELIERSARRHGENFTGVDIVAHSMGGLVVREGLRRMHQAREGSAFDLVHRVVTLGTPHRGIAFQRAPDWLLRMLPPVAGAEDELSAFDPTKAEFTRWATCFDVSRVLTVVGTNYRTYGPAVASAANRWSTLTDEGSLATNRSDGLVKQASAQLPGAPRTFVHKCHGGADSLVTSREAYEIAMRFFHGSHKVSLWLDAAEISRGGDLFGRSEFYLGVSIKPRFVDFELMHQDSESENCYGPFRRADLMDDLPDLEGELRKPLAEFGDRTTGWAGPDRLVWEGWIDAAFTTGVGDRAPGASVQGLVFRLDVYVGERDSYGIGFSDNVVFRKQYYVQVFPGDPWELYVHTGEKYLGTRSSADQGTLRTLARPEAGAEVQAAGVVPDRPDQRTFRVVGTGFGATFRIGVESDRQG